MWNGNSARERSSKSLSTTTPMGSRAPTTTNNNKNDSIWRILPSWLRPRNDDAGDEAATAFSAQSSDNPFLWPLDRCAIYHHFDVENGKSLWLITAAEGEENKLPPVMDNFPLFRDVKDARFSVNVLSTSPRTNTSVLACRCCSGWQTGP